jgi:outer membrane receptor protein involved in Fe transport
MAQMASKPVTYGLLVLSVATPVNAQVSSEDAANREQSAEIVVTAQKREQILGDVPVSLQVLDTQMLTQRGISRLDDYAKFLPSLSYASFGPGQAEVFFRGLSNGNRLATGSLPTVGVYLDEQPVTTIGSVLDVHIYDIARVEALAGPQGTLYGASSEAGVVRIITNKPRQGAYEAGLDFEVNSVAHGGIGGSVEGFANVPLSDRVALRVVGFAVNDAGYIDNVANEPDLVFPTSGVLRDNRAFRGDDLNSVETIGGRAALGIDLDDDWTITPSVMAQRRLVDGTFGFRPTVGDLENVRYAPDTISDRWVQAALVIEGKIGRFDVTYAGAYLDRTVSYAGDYSDYAFFYDTYYAATPDYFGNQFFNNAGELIDPSQIVTQTENFSKQSHELRIASPASDSLRVVAGLFYQRQTNDWTNLYTVRNLADSQSVTGRPGVNYANIQYRVDRDYAAFAELSYDILSNLTATGGLRFYRYDNDVVGFFGFNANRSPVGEAGCLPGTIGIYGTERPCDNIDASASGSGVLYKLNASWRAAPGKLFYATWSTGFRPGGINRRPDAAPYEAETLTNYEIGAKTSWADGRVRFNATLFLEKLNDAQFAVTSDQNGITDIVNAGKAESKGVEADFTLLPLKGLSLQASATYADAVITTDLCKFTNPTLDCSIPNANGEENSVVAPAGTRFPNSPIFKMAATTRYEFDLGKFEASLQGSVLYQSSSLPSLDTAEAELLGIQPAYTTVDISAGLSRRSWSLTLAAQNLFDARGQQLRTASCAIALCGPDSIQVFPIRPRLVSLRLSWRY